MFNAIKFVILMVLMCFFSYVITVNAIHVGDFKTVFLGTTLFYTAKDVANVVWNNVAIVTLLVSFYQFMVVIVRKEGK